MTTFNFTASNGGYVAHLTIEDAAALHVERQPGRVFSIGVKSFDEDSHKYAVVNKDHYNETIIDCDLVSEVYPKYIELFSDSQVTLAAVS